MQNKKQGKQMDEKKGRALEMVFSLNENENANESRNDLSRASSLNFSGQRSIPNNHFSSQVKEEETIVKSIELNVRRENNMVKPTSNTAINKNNQKDEEITTDILDTVSDLGTEDLERGEN